MVSTRVRRGFTLIELLVVVAIIALLISILLPSLAGAREQGKKVVCLSNMSQIGKASHSYANDDEREQLIPLQRMMVSTLSSVGFVGTEWSWRTARIPMERTSVPRTPNTRTMAPSTIRSAKPRLASRS